MQWVNIVDNNDSNMDNADDKDDYEATESDLYVAPAC